MTEQEDNTASSQAFELLFKSKSRKELVVRDDQYEFQALLDSVRNSRRKGNRFSLVDSGLFDKFHLEWLGEAGADIYTSDKARSLAEEVELVSRACRKGNAIVAYFLNGDLGEEERPQGPSIGALKELARSGVYLHISNREKPRDFAVLSELAHRAVKGGARLIYYHHRTSSGRIEEAAGSGAWFHVSSRSLQKEEDVHLFLMAAQAASRSGANGILHLDHALPLSWLEDILAAGSFILFNLPPSDSKSRLRKIERRAHLKRPDFRAYYLSPLILP